MGINRGLKLGAVLTAGFLCLQGCAIAPESASGSAYENPVFVERASVGTNDPGTRLPEGYGEYRRDDWRDDGYYRDDDYRRWDRDDGYDRDDRHDRRDRTWERPRTGDLDTPDRYGYDRSRWSDVQKRLYLRYERACLDAEYTDDRRDLRRRCDCAMDGVARKIDRMDTPRGRMLESGIESELRQSLRRRCAYGARSRFGARLGGF